MDMVKTHHMKKIIILFLLGMFPLLLSAQYYNGTQSQIKQQFMAEVDVAANVVADCAMSFFDNPYHHSNTKKIYDLMDKSEKTLRDYNEKYWSMSILDDNTYYKITNSLKYTRILSELTGGIGYNHRGRFNASDFETLVMPILNMSGWSWKAIAHSDYAIAYEFQKEKFKMLLVKNILPATTSEQMDRGEFSVNMIRYDLFYYNVVLKRERMYTASWVDGGEYILVKFVDDENQEAYPKITKMTSVKSKGDGK